jgi:hypothetical protein
MSREHLVEWELVDETKLPGKKSAPMPLCPPQIPRDLTWDRTWAAEVVTRWVTSWATARRSHFLSKAFQVRRPRATIYVWSICLLFGKHWIRISVWKPAVLIGFSKFPSWNIYIHGNTYLWNISFLIRYYLNNVADRASLSKSKLQ